MGTSGSKSDSREGRANPKVEGSTSNTTIGPQSPSAGYHHRVRMPGIVSVVGIPETHSPIERVKVYAPHYLQILVEREQQKIMMGGGAAVVGGGEQIPKRHNAIRLIEESDEALDALLALVSTSEALTDLLDQKIGQSSSSSTADVPPPPLPSSTDATSTHCRKDDFSQSVISDRTARIILKHIHEIIGGANNNTNNILPPSPVLQLGTKEALLMRTVNTPQCVLDELASHMAFPKSSPDSASMMRYNTHQGQHSHGTSAGASKKGTSSRHEHRSQKSRDKKESLSSSSSPAHAPNSSEIGGGNNNSDNKNNGVRVSVGSSVDPQKEWYLLFSTKYHGRSFNQLVGAICQRGPTVVVIEAFPEEKEHESEEEYRKRCHTVTVPKGDGLSGEKTSLPYWREELKCRAGQEGCEQNNAYDNNNAYSYSSPQTSEGKETVPSRVFIGGYNTCNWLNAAQRERLAKREAAAAARGGGSAGGGGGGGSPSPHPYATGTLSFLNETMPNGTSGNISSTTDPTGSTDPASIAGIFSPTTNPAYEPSVPYGMRQGSLFSGNSNCWVFRADTFQVADDAPQPSTTSNAAAAGGSADRNAKNRDSPSSASDVLRADRNYGYYNGRGCYSENLSQLRVFRPNTSRSSSLPSEAANKRKATPAGGTAAKTATACDANYQYVVEKHPVDANKVGVGMGGDVDEWAWFLDKWLSAGSCNKTSNYSGGNNNGGGYGGDDDDEDAFRLRRCPTFNTLLLAPWQRWRIESVEVFAVDPSAVDHYKAVDCLHAEGARRADDGSGGAAAAAILASARERKRREKLGLSQSTDSLSEESESAPARNKERRLSDAQRKATQSHIGDSKVGPQRPLFITPVATTTTGEFLSNIIGSAYGDCTEALKAHFNEVCLRATKRQYGGSGSGGHPRQRGPREGVLHSDGAACDKMILELNNNNEFRDDVVEDDGFDRVAGC